jgi:hypothetical protein
MRRTKGASHVLSPFAANHQPGLIAGVTQTLEDIRHPRSRETLRNALRDWIDMVEASPAAAARMQGDTDDQIRPRDRLPGDPPGQLRREMIDREADRDTGTEGTPSVLEAGNPPPDGAFVASQRATMM